MCPSDTYSLYEYIVVDSKNFYKLDSVNVLNYLKKVLY